MPTGNAAIPAPPPRVPPAQWLSLSASLLSITTHSPLLPPHAWDGPYPARHKCQQINSFFFFLALALGVPSTPPLRKEEERDVGGVGQRVGGTGMNWRGVGDNKSGGVPFFPPGVEGRGSFLIFHLLTSQHCHHP